MLRISNIYKYVKQTKQIIIHKLSFIF